MCWVLELQNWLQWLLFLRHCFLKSQLCTGTPNTWSWRMITTCAAACFMFVSCTHMRIHFQPGPWGITFQSHQPNIDDRKFMHSFPHICQGATLETLETKTNKPKHQERTFIRLPHSKFIFKGKKKIQIPLKTRKLRYHHGHDNLQISNYLQHVE